MRILTNAPARLLLLAALLCLVPAAAARAQASKEAPVVIEGRITDGEKGLPGVAVVLLDAARREGPTRPSARAKTDHEGRYRLSGVPPGSYFVRPVAPTYVLEAAERFEIGRRLTLAAGETASDVDFRLTPGGVITGRVTDADNQPVIGETVFISPADPAQPTPSHVSVQRNQTDDRGVYRIFGLPPGRYHVSAGQDTEAGDIQTNMPGRFYRRTYHPAAFEQKEARVVEVTAGGEATEVDITLGRASKTYRASGRLVNPDGRPAPGLWVTYGLLDREARAISAFGGGVATNARGEFELAGLVPGRYVVFTSPMDDTPSEHYSDAVPFDIDGADVSGLEVKLRPGASLSGVAVVEGTSDPAKASWLLRRVRVAAHVEAAASSSAAGAPNYSVTIPEADGSFRLTGLRPGKARLGTGWSSETPALALVRVELNGVVQNDGFELAEGARLSGLRVVLVYGESTVRGQVNVVGGQLAPDERVYVFARRPGAGEDEQQGPYGKGAEADARGRFIIEGLAAGSYELAARVFSPRAGSRRHSQRVPVAVSEGGEATATITLNLGEQ